MGACEPDCTKHKGHRRYVGGPRDGAVDSLIYADPSDYPQTMGSILMDSADGKGTRHWYEIDYEASVGTEVVYRFVGWGKEFPQRSVQGAGE